jgi:hypothetical protein
MAWSLETCTTTLRKSSPELAERCHSRRSNPKKDTAKLPQEPALPDNYMQCFPSPRDSRLPAAGVPTSRIIDTGDIDPVAFLIYRA